MVKVSVVIPFYNVEDYFEECISSIVNQTLDDMEIICINDGSADNSLKILEGYANSDNRIKIVSQENKGASASRNQGIKLSEGEYIYFMDSDDILELNALEELYKFSESNNLDILIFKMMSFNDETGEKYAIKYYDMPFLKPFNQKVFNYKDIGVDALRMAVSPPGKFFKRDLIKPIEFLEGYIFEDNLKKFSTTDLSCSAVRLAMPVFSIIAYSSLFLPMTYLRSLPSMVAMRWKLPLYACSIQMLETV